MGRIRVNACLWTPPKSPHRLRDGYGWQRSLTLHFVCAPVVHYPLRFDKHSLNLVKILNCDAITALDLLSCERAGPEESEGALEVVAVRDFRLPNSNPKAVPFALDVCLHEWGRMRPWRDVREAHWAPRNSSNTV